MYSAVQIFKKEGELIVGEEEEKEEKKEEETLPHVQSIKIIKLLKQVERKFQICYL